mmetsp:Transcript_10571/g.18150  ORF Transcript_10571/g.18150 Transcript_10571/m.18150 type:complete len:95 (+) Transcript_10571:52-336(+)
MPSLGLMIMVVVVMDEDVNMALALVPPLLKVDSTNAMFDGLRSTDCFWKMNVLEYCFEVGKTSNAVCYSEKQRVLLFTLPCNDDCDERNVTLRM